MNCQIDTFPLVSIIAVCYNQQNFVKETLNSILHQTYSNIQLIIADDGSTDNSKHVIEQWVRQYRPDTIFINHTQNVGLTKNINSALPFVTGSYMQVFGCDDIMLPHKISLQVSLMESNTNLGIVYSDMFMIDNESKKYTYSYYEKHSYKKPVSGWLYYDLIDRFVISAPSVLIRSVVLDELKSYNEKLVYEDHDFFLRASKKFEFLYINEKTVHYRASIQSLSTLNHGLKFFKSTFLVYYINFDSDDKYRYLFKNKLLFYAKNLYALRFKLCTSYFFKAFFKTRDFQFLKYGIAAIPFYFNGKKE